MQRVVWQALHLEAIVIYSQAVLMEFTICAEKEKLCRNCVLGHRVRGVGDTCYIALAGRR